MDILYSPSVEELLKANKYLLKNTSAKETMSDYRWFYTMLAFFMIAWMSLFIEYSFKSSILVGIVVALIIFLISPKLLENGSNKKVKKQILSGQAEKFLSEKKIILAETNIQICSSIRTSTTLYSAVASVDEVQEIIYIKFIYGDYFYLPSRSFKSSEEKDCFIAYMLQRASQAMNQTSVQE